ncbi:hypothetical protein [Lignipirellula cremea]|uniref:hypothetical protein n=1 Tax=Lignipirellula cremea TaxID=2528010 RepID=UPI0011A6DADD|nr:hypothetical protein [Lignipirellula cremea]
MDTHPDVRFLETDRLSAELPEVASWELSKTLVRLAEGGDLRLGYMVRTPSGPLLQSVYDNVSDIPTELEDRFFQHTFEVRDENILPVFFFREELK